MFKRLKKIFTPHVSAPKKIAERGNKEEEIYNPSYWRNRHLCDGDAIHKQNYSRDSFIGMKKVTNNSTIA